MWVEKYRPAKLDDLVNQKAIRQRLEQMLEKKEQLPHLLFAGPPGSGKTTTAMIIAKQILGDSWVDYTLALNASDERGIDIVRERVKTFARFSDRREGVPYRIVILDECDEMCLDPETEVLAGGLDDLRRVTLRDLEQQYGDGWFDIPTLNLKSRAPESDKGRIVKSGEADLYRVELSDGRTLIASAAHPFFVFSSLGATVVRTQDLRPGSEVADFSAKFLKCHNCQRPFYRRYGFEAYTFHFCSATCRNVFFGSISRGRSETERARISKLAHDALRASGVQQSDQYRKTRSEIATRLVREGKIPDPRQGKKFGKGEGAWLGKKLTREHRKAIAAGDRRYFEAHPEVRRAISEKSRLSLAKADGAYRTLVRSGFFKEASKTAYLASVEYWKRNGFRSKLELKMAGLLEKWGVRYSRERLVFRDASGNPYPFAVDFVLGERTALLVNGCWWHVCPDCGVEPKYDKQRKNMEKDSRHIAELERQGYRVVVVWEHELENEQAIRDEVTPKVLQAVGISGGSLTRVKHATVQSIKYVGRSPVLNISARRNHNFFLANGILTHNTSDAQTALRRIMEETATYTRFILVCNYSTGIIEPLQSRCAIFRFQRLDEAAVVDHLKEIAKKEKLKADGAGAFAAVFEATQGDLRQAINLMQAASASGELTPDAVKAVTGATVKSRVAEVIKTALDGDFEGSRTKMIELTRVYGVPERDFLKFANEALGSMKVADLGKAISIIAEYDFRLVQGAQPELQLTAMLAQLSALGRKGD